MGMNVKVTGTAVNPMVEIQTRIREGLLEAGKTVLAVSDALAPTEPVPRHGIHMVETGFAQVEPGLDGDRVAVGYRAYWARWQHEDLNYDHPHGGEAKFLEHAALQSKVGTMEIIAGKVRTGGAG